MRPSACWKRTVRAYQRSLELTENRYKAGVAARVDVVQAEVQLKSTQASLIDLGVERAHSAACTARSAAAMSGRARGSEACANPDLRPLSAIRRQHGTIRRRRRAVAARRAELRALDAEIDQARLRAFSCTSACTTSTRARRPPCSGSR